MKSRSNLFKKQLKIGMKVEAEHKPTVSFIKAYALQHKRLPPEQTIYRQIALNHIKEDPLYYSKLKKAKL